ncbi:hypothetical protein CR513_42597, partial [Mucuna pruriens]
MLVKWKEEAMIQDVIVKSIAIELQLEHDFLQLMELDNVTNLIKFIEVGVVLIAKEEMRDSSDDMESYSPKTRKSVNATVEALSRSKDKSNGVSMHENKGSQKENPNNLSNKSYRSHRSKKSERPMRENRHKEEEPRRERRYEEEPQRIQDIVELNYYISLDDLVHQATRVESQQRRHLASKRSYLSGSSSWKVLGQRTHCFQYSNKRNMVLREDDNVESESSHEDSSSSSEVESLSDSSHDKG